MKEKFTGLCIVFGSLIIAMAIWFSPSSTIIQQTDKLVTTVHRDDGTTVEVEHEYYYYNSENQFYRYDLVQETLEGWSPIYRMWLWKDSTNDERKDYFKKRKEQAESYGIDYVPLKTVDMLYE